MSAIYGSVGDASQGEVETLGRRLVHRGADEVVWSPLPGVRFGWRATGVANPNGRAPEVPLIFTGTIENRQALADLLGRGLRGVTKVDDAELLWALYRRHGSDAFAWINGQFAIALADAETGAVVLAVDRLATQPLYVTTSATCSAFANEAKALLALDGVPTLPHRDALSIVQRTKYLPAAWSPLAGVAAVPPNGIIKIQDHHQRITEYPRLTLDIGGGVTDEQHADELRQTLLTAAQRLTDGIDRIGIGLSAGLDSAVTLGAVRAAAPGRPIYTYTAAFDPGDPDLARAAQVAAHFGTIHRPIILSPDDLPQLLPQLVWHMEDPICREEMVVYMVLARQAARDVPVVLYGHLADVLFGGMPRHLLVKMASSWPPFETPLSEFYDYTQTGALPRSMVGRMLVAGYFRGRQVAPPRVLETSPSVPGKRLKLARSEPLNEVLLASLAEGPTEVAAMERLHAAVDIRYGSIFHDQDVARCAFRIPDRLKICGRKQKYILRRAARGFLPARFAARPKGLIRIGRNPGLVRTIETMVDELLSPQAVVDRGLFDPADVVRLRRRPADGSYGDGQFYHLWTMLLIEIWARTFLDGRGAGPVTLAGADQILAMATTNVGQQLELTVKA